MSLIEYYNKKKSEKMKSFKQRVTLPISSDVIERIKSFKTHYNGSKSKSFFQIQEIS